MTTMVRQDRIARIAAGNDGVQPRDQFPQGLQCLYTAHAARNGQVENGDLKWSVLCQCRAAGLHSILTTLGQVGIVAQSCQRLGQ